MREMRILSVSAMLLLMLFGCSDGTDETTATPTPPSTLFTETFSGIDGSAWNHSWSIVTSSAYLDVDIQNNRGRIRGRAFDGVSTQSGSTRVVNSAVDMRNVDVRFTVEFEDFHHQGIGFYVRQNGGYLTQTTPAGQGYAVFWEGGFQRNLGLWYELAGTETMLASVQDPLGYDAVLDNTVYHVRYQVKQLDSSQTIQRARVWPDGEVEPNSWQVETVSSFIELQDVNGGIAVDLFNYSGTGSVYIDDLQVTALSIPVG